MEMMSSTISGIIELDYHILEDEMVDIRIVYDEQSGRVQISGLPLNNKLLVYGLIELVKEQVAKQEPGRIIVPDPIPSTIKI